MCLVNLFIAVAVVTTIQSQLQNTTTHDPLSQTSCNDVINTTWPPISVRVDLLPADELRALVADRKRVAVHVTLGEVLPPRGRTTNCSTAPGNGNFGGL